MPVPFGFIVSNITPVLAKCEKEIRVYDLGELSGRTLDPSEYYQYSSKEDSG